MFSQNNKSDQKNTCEELKGLSVRDKENLVHFIQRKFLLGKLPSDSDHRIVIENIANSYIERGLFQLENEKQKCFFSDLFQEWKGPIYKSCNSFSLS